MEEKKNRNYNDTDLKIYHEGNKVITHQSQDCTAAIEQAKLAKQLTGGKSKLGYHAGKIPMVLLLKWGMEDAGDQLAYLQGRQHKEPELAKKLTQHLNSNEFRDFRIWEGEIAASDMLKEGNKMG